jgi:hypothetical protein
MGGMYLVLLFAFFGSIPGAVIGGLASRWRGAVIGAIVGAILGPLIWIVGMVVLWPRT